jgi:geranylgeranyl pyrophosphate synthase
VLISQPVTLSPGYRKPMDATVRPTAVETTAPINGALDANALFAPIRPGLRQVEIKLRGVDSALFAPLADAFINLIGSGGKRLRPALALLTAETNGAMQGTPRYNAVVALASAVEMLHTATLVHDDVIDGALLRRGAPTLNAQWSGIATVLAGNYLFGTAARFSAETQTMRVIELFSNTLRIIVDGELHQLKDRYDFVQKKDNYYQRIFAKTASLFCAATQGAAILARMPEDRIDDLYQFGYNFGMAFQIVDDILDFTGDDATLGKPAGSDLRQGTLTLPFFHYLQQHPNAADVIEALEAAQATADDGDSAAWDATVTTLVYDLRTSSAVEAAREEARSFLRRAVDNLAALPDSIFHHSLQGLCEFVVKRTY